MERLMRKKPNLLIVGPQKAGTTWLYEVFKQDKNIYVNTEVKETFYFDERYNLGRNWYLNHFTDIQNEKIVCEVAPSYFHCIESINRIKKELGRDVKIVVTLREPTSRTISWYKHLNKYGEVKKDIKLTDEQVVQTSYYDVYIKEWLSNFGDNIKVVFFEDFKKDKYNYMRELYDFLDLDINNIQLIENNVYEGGGSPRSNGLLQLARKIAELLRKYQLYRLLNLINNSFIRSIFFSQKKETEISEEDINILRKKFISHNKELEKEIDRKLPLEWY